MFARRLCATTSLGCVARSPCRPPARAAGDYKRNYGQKRFTNEFANNLANAVAPKLDADSVKALKTDIAKLDPATLTSTKTALAEGDKLAIKGQAAKRDDAGLGLAFKEAAKNFVKDNNAAVSRKDFADAVGRAFGEPKSAADTHTKNYASQRLDAQFPPDKPFPPTSSSAFTNEF